MVNARLLKGKTKVLTSTRARETRTVDPEIKYWLMNIERLEGVVTNRRADTTRERHQGTGQ